MAARKRILAVDDNELNLEIMEEILAEEYTLLTASSGEQALEIMARQEPDLVLLDIMMPGINGYETCRRIKADPRLSRTMVILVSAKAMTAERLQGYEVGADDYLTKPFDPEELQAKVRVFLRLKSTEEVDAMKGELLNLVAHEIRTPLTGILPAAEVLSKNEVLGDEERRMWGQMVLDNGQRLLSLTEHGILLCRFRAGEVDLNGQSVEIGQIITRVVQEYSGAASMKDTTIASEVAQRSTVHGDSELLETAARCMVEGALRLARGTCELRIELTEAEGRTKVCLRLTEGELDQDALDRLFEPFAPREIEGETVGSELAMSLARAIAQAHDGDVTAYPEAGGLCFAADFPSSCHVPA